MNPTPRSFERACPQWKHPTREFIGCTRCENAQEAGIEPDMHSCSAPMRSWRASWNNNKDTALHRACREGNAELVRALLANSADPNLRNNDEDTPLMVAAKAGEKECIRLLLCQSTVHVLGASGVTASEHVKRVEPMEDPWHELKSAVESDIAYADEEINHMIQHEEYSRIRTTIRNLIHDNEARVTAELENKYRALDKDMQRYMQNWRPTCRDPQYAYLFPPEQRGDFHREGCTCWGCENERRLETAQAHNFTPADSTPIRCATCNLSKVFHTGFRGT